MMPAWLNELTAAWPGAQVVTEFAERQRLSRDFYWYSPVLKRELEHHAADAVVLARTPEDVRRIVDFAFARRVPLTLRGAGTGNYGQCIPAQGGIVLDLAALDRILEITDEGVAVCEPAVRLGAIETAAREAGWELRCYPSTVQKASVAGFCAGGSGGIGSITWGGLRENGTVNALTILTMEDAPREIRLSGRDIFKVLHAWGTNGIIMQVELRLAPRTRWAQAAVAHPDFAAAFDFAETVARDESLPKRLVTVFEWPVPSYFTPLQRWVPPGRALGFFEVADEQLARFEAAARAAGGTVAFSAPGQQPRRGSQLSDFTWNHTTLWALKADPTLTYLQCGFSPLRAREQMAALKARFGAEIEWHFEFVKSEGVITPGALPIVRFTTEARLNEIIQACGEAGVSVANPHVNFLEGSGRWRPDDEKLLAKQSFDPRGLLNPGKMRGFAATLERVGNGAPVSAPAP
ncbi:MAG: FAD-binding oxidoreductase [Limisphaerales bacterium]